MTRVSLSGEPLGLESKERRWRRSSAACGPRLIGNNAVKPYFLPFWLAMTDSRYLGRDAAECPKLVLRAHQQPAELDHEFIIGQPQRAVGKIRQHGPQFEGGANITN